MHTSRFILGSRSNSRCLCWIPCWPVCIAVCALLQFNSFLGLLRQIYSVVIKRILNSCIQISHHNFEYLLHTQFQDSFSLIFFQKMFRCCPLLSGSIRVSSNSFFEHSHLPIDVWVRVIDGRLNEHSSEVSFCRLLKNNPTSI